MGNMIRAISDDGSVMVCAVNSTDMIAKMEQIHKPSAVVTAALGRLTTAASIMGAMLKGKDDTVTLRMNGSGKTGTLIAVANSKGNVKSYVDNPIVEIPLNSQGKLDVSGAVGKDGVLSVVKDLGLKEPFIGKVPIATGEIAEDITHYYATSEQTPTVCGLGVLVNPDLSVKAAGGYLLQLLPFADESVIDVIENNLKVMPSVSKMFDDGLTPTQVCDMLLKDIPHDVLDEFDTEYKCDCSKKRIERALISLGSKEIKSLIEEQETVQVECHFCDKKYVFGKDDMIRLLKESEKR